MIEYVPAIIHPEIHEHRFALLTSEYNDRNVRVEVGTVLAPGIALRVPRIPEYDECLIAAAIYLAGGSQTRAKLARAVPIGLSSANAAVKRLEERGAISGPLWGVVSMTPGAQYEMPPEIVVPLLDPPIEVKQIYLVAGEALDVGQEIRVIRKRRSPVRRKVTRVFDVRHPDGRMVGEVDKPDTPASRE